VPGVSWVSAPAWNNRRHRRVTGRSTSTSPRPTASRPRRRAPGAARVFPVPRSEASGARFRLSRGAHYGNWRRQLERRCRLPARRRVFPTPARPGRATAEATGKLPPTGPVVGRRSPSWTGLVLPRETASFPRFPGPPRRDLGGKCVQAPINPLSCPPHLASPLPPVTGRQPARSAPYGLRAAAGKLHHHDTPGRAANCARLPFTQGPPGGVMDLGSRPTDGPPITITKQLPPEKYSAGGPSAAGIQNATSDMLSRKTRSVSYVKIEDALGPQAGGCPRPLQRLLCQPLSRGSRAEP